MKINWKAIVFFLIVIGLWQLVFTIGWFNQSLFPAPLTVLKSIIYLFVHENLLYHIFTSLWRISLGLIIGASFGVLCGILMGRILFLDESIAPFFNILRAFPPVALIPLIIVWFGIGDIAKIFSIAFAVFFPVWLSTLIGSKNVPKDYLKVAKVFVKSKTKIFYKVIFPSTIPFIMNGIRLGIGTAYVMAFVSELAGASSGLGYVIAYSQIIYRIDNMLAGLIVLGTLAALTDFCFVKSAKHIFPWVKINEQ